jgi:hypothetical protein
VDSGSPKASNMIAQADCLSAATPDPLLTMQWPGWIRSGTQ